MGTMERMILKSSRFFDDQYIEKGLYHVLAVINDLGFENITLVVDYEVGET